MLSKISKLVNCNHVWWFQFSLYNTNINDALSWKCFNFVFKILQNEKIINIENYLKKMKKYINRNESSSLNRALIKYCQISLN